MLCFQLYPRPSRPKHGSCSGKHLFQTTRLIADKLLISSRFPHKFRNNPALILTEMLIWNEKDSVNMANLLTKPNCFAFLPDRAIATNYTRHQLTNTSSLDRSGHELRREPFIRVVRVLCRLHSYKRFHSRLIWGAAYFLSYKPGAPNGCFLQNALKKLVRLSRVL